MLELPCHTPREQITTVGVIGAKKLVKIAKALLKARKERSLGSVEDVSVIATTQGSGDEEEQEDEVCTKSMATRPLRVCFLFTHYSCNIMGQHNNEDQIG